MLQSLRSVDDICWLRLHVNGRNLLERGGQADAYVDVVVKDLDARGVQVKSSRGLCRIVWPADTVKSTTSHRKPTYSICSDVLSEMPLRFGLFQWRVIVSEAGGILIPDEGKNRALAGQDEQ